MRLMARLRHRLRSVIQSRTLDRDLDDELQFHVQQQAALFEDRGMSRSAALAAARRAFGSQIVAAEACRDARGWRLWADAGRDLRFGWRAAVRGRGTMAAAVVTLGLGIGAATAMFSVVDAVLLRPLPFAEPDRLIRADQYVAPGALRVLRERQRAFAALGAIQPDVEVNLGASPTPERVTAIVASDGVLEMLGVQPAFGRPFTADDVDAGAPRVAILGHGLWRRRFGSSRDVIGRVVQVDGLAREIVGVLPAGALPPLPDADLWLPATTSGVAPAELWGSSYFALLGRVRPGVTAAAATEDLRRLAPAVRDSYPWRMPDVFGAEITAVPLLESLIGDVRLRLWLLCAAVSLLLCAACANVATLVLSRALLREREFALRAALGASRRRLMQQLVTESLALWLVGGATGVLVAYLGLDVVRAWLPADVPRLGDLAIAWRAVAIGLAATLVTGLVFGLLPAWRMSRPALLPFLKANDGGVATTAGRQVVVKTLVVVQLVLAVVLVSGSVLLSRSLWNLSHVPPGLDPDDVLSATITPDRLACAAPAQCDAFYDRVAERLGARAPGDGRRPRQPATHRRAVAVVCHRFPGPPRRAWRACPYRAARCRDARLLRRPRPARDARPRLVRAGPDIRDAGGGHQRGVGATVLARCRPGGQAAPVCLATDVADRGGRRPRCQAGWSGGRGADGVLRAVRPGTAARSDPAGRVVHAPTAAGP